MGLPFLTAWQVTCSPFQAILLKQVWHEVTMENIDSTRRVFSQYSVMVRWGISCEWKKGVFRKMKKLHVESHSKARKDL